MEKTLFDLNLQEFKIYSLIAEQYGTMEEKDDQLNALGIFIEYQDVFTNYSTLAFSNMEALKRAIFIQWYAASEPRCFTGIGDLEKKTEQDNISLMNDHALNNKLDDEFTLMAIYYNNVTDWYFKSFTNNDFLLGMLQAHQNLKLYNLKLLDMENRGCMCKYWNSIDRNLLYEI